MSPQLKPLLCLPKLVEERRNSESMSDSEMDMSSSSFPQTSSSEIPSPVTPTFSHRHLRYPSSTSSVESAFHTPATESPSSPTLLGPKTGKRSLPDVQEEPHERDDSDMLENNELYDCLCDDQQCMHRDASMIQSSMQLSSDRQDFDYDMGGGFLSDGEFSLSPRHKKRRANDSPLTGLATRFGTRFPSFSRKWRLGTGSSAASVNLELQEAISRGPSSRSSSISISVRYPLDKSFESQMPPTPTKSIYGSREEISSASIDIEKANRLSEDREQGLATTPLLPPLMMDASANTKNIPLLSPLQSPSVAESNDPFLTGTITPIDTIVSTPQFPGMPSPPLSNKPSISSFHHVNRPGHLIPSSEIPTLVIADPNDEWANKLGHANYTIYPEPYIPITFDLEACRQLRANWDLARCNYTKHLVRTGEHYGTTSKTYKLTEEKWALTDLIWRKHNDLTIANTVENSADAFATLKHNTFGDSGNNNIMTKIPLLNDPCGGGKFPQLGDEDIVGPMVQVTATLQRSPSKKAKLFRFFTEKFPVGLGKP